MAAAQKGGSGKVMMAMVVAGDEQAWWKVRLAKNGECVIMVIEAHGMESSSIRHEGLAWRGTGSAIQLDNVSCATFTIIEACTLLRTNLEVNRNGIGRQT